MASLPFTSLFASDQGLFTPEELQSLMEKELSRSQRYGYEVLAIQEPSLIGKLKPSMSSSLPRMAVNAVWRARIGVASSPILAASV